MLLSTIYRLVTATVLQPSPLPPISLPEAPPPGGPVGEGPAPGGPSVEVNPTSEGAPGTETIQTLLDWLAQFSLWACLAALLAGGGLFAWGRRQGAHSMAMTGTALAGGGAVGVILVGLAPQIVTALYSQT